MDQIRMDTYGYKFKQSFFFLEFRFGYGHCQVVSLCWIRYEWILTSYMILIIQIWIQCQTLNIWTWILTENIRTISRVTGYSQYNVSRIGPVWHSLSLVSNLRKKKKTGKLPKHRFFFSTSAAIDRESQKLEVGRIQLCIQDRPCLAWLISSF